MTKANSTSAGGLATKDYITLGLSTLALLVSSFGFYFQYIKEKYALYVGISDVHLSLDASSHPSGTFLFSNKGNRQAIILEVGADIFPASESFSTDNCKLPYIQRVAGLKWISVTSSLGTVKPGPVLLKPDDIFAYNNVEFAGLSNNEIVMSSNKSHNNIFLLVCWSVTYYSRSGYIIENHFASTVAQFDLTGELREQRTPTSLLLLKQ